MKKQYIYSALILTALLTAGCAKEMGNTLESSDSAAIELSSVSTDPMTKAVITGTSFTTDEATAGIGLSLLDKDGKAYGSNEPNVKYEFNSGKWTAASPLRVGNSKGYLFGYYPYSESITDITAIPVASSANGTDWLYATPVEVTTANAKSISLSLSHALARISLSFRLDESYVGDGSLSEISLSGDCVTASGTLDATDGSITATASKFTAGTELTLSKSAATTLECLVVPVSNESNTHELKIACTIGGKAYSMTFTGDIAALTQGKQITIELIVKNTSITVDGSSIGVWGEGGTQTVTVGGNYKVTIALADGITAHDVLADAYADGSNVIIKAISFQGRGLVCNVGDKAQCERTFTNDKFTFTISNISSNIDAVLGYAPLATLTVSSDSNGKVWIGDDENKTSGQYEFEEQVEIHARPNDNFRLFKWNDNNKEINRTITVGITNVTYSASFISADLIPGLFTVNSGCKQVFFSKGNLWYGNLYGENAATFHLESNQYDSTPSTNADRDENHISHFMWCCTAEKAMALKYDSEWNYETPFFAEKDFTVNGYNGWRVLTGGIDGEWGYLLNNRETAYGTNRRYAAVKVNGMAGLLLFPDDFSSWPSGAGDEPQTFNTNSPNFNNRNYSADQFTVLQNNGCVFLPATGWRGAAPSLPFPALVGKVGSDGYYWSASPLNDNIAYDLFFNDGSVDPADYDARFRAKSVRLVTESK